ncbi:MAG: DNA adenine methylase [Candidatus Moranbacteria bacterium]|nr:DNA adenine methylase [Candidatus Moranbacteria bacterium]
MSGKQEIKIIQETFDINAIYARRVFASVNISNFLEEARQIITSKPKPFVKWVGGKRQLLKQFRLLDLYPPDEFDPEKARYFEPFVGGGAVFFDLLPRKAYLSDLNFELVTTYNVIKNDVEKLITSLKKQKYNKEYYLKIRSKNPERLSDLQIATRFIFLNRAGFNGMYRVNSKGGFNVPFGKYENPLICDEKNLRKVSKALQNVEIKHQDYKFVLKKAKKRDFIYFDPPYHPVSKTAAFTSYTSQGFGEKEQIELRDTFLKLHKRGCFVMLSNSDAPFINKIYSEIKKYGVRINKVEAGRAINSKASGRGKITEILVTNY